MTLTKSNGNKIINAYKYISNNPHHIVKHEKGKQQKKYVRKKIKKN